MRFVRAKPGAPSEETEAGVLFSLAVVGLKVIGLRTDLIDRIFAKRSAQALEKSECAFSADYQSSEC